MDSDMDITLPRGVNTDISICNKALRYLGASEIVSLTQGSQEAKLCSRYYFEARNEVLELHNWSFNIRYSSLALLHEAPVWGFSRAYMLPNDCLCVRALQSGHAFRILEGKKLYTNAYPAHAIMSVRVEDASVFSALFTEALARRLAAALAIPLVGNANLEESMSQRFFLALDAARLADSSSEQGVPVAGVDTGVWLVGEGL